MKRFIAKIILTATFFIQLAAHAEVPQLPEDWYVNPEDSEAWMSMPAFFPTLPWTKKAKMEKMVKSIYEVNRTAVETASEKQSFATPLNPIPNWTPWHLEAFTTELSVMGSGLIGVLTGKGTATAQAYWRKRGSHSVAKPLVEEAPNDLPTLNIQEVDNFKSLQYEIEPMVKSVLATGTVKDETAFRRNIEFAASEFFNLVNGIRDNPKSQWWVSGMRIEFSVSASGKLTPAVPVVSVGGDVRVRFDWKRLARKNNNRILNTSNSSLAFFGFPGSRSQLQGSLQDLVNSFTEDLSATFEEKFDAKGFKPHGFRLAIGFTSSGTVGIAKSSAAAIASIAFSTDVNDPAKAVAKPTSDAKPLLLIEKNPSEKHLQFATNNLIPYSLEVSKTRAVYTLNRKNFRKGLRKAVKMANFFVNAGSKAGSKKWKLYQMKTGFEFSLTGTVGLVKFSGSSSAEMAFYNMNF